MEVGWGIVRRVRGGQTSIRIISYEAIGEGAVMRCFQGIYLVLSNGNSALLVLDIMSKLANKLT